LSGTILISTHRLPLAGRLREAFRAEEFDTDLVPDPTRLEVAREPSLLILTGETGEVPAEQWVEQATERLGIPVFASLPALPSAPRVRALGIEETLPPEPDPAEVVLLAKRTIERRRLQQITGIVGESEAMREALERVVQIAPVDSTVLITGESGTGKELVARGIHALSPRRHRAFLGVNVAALPETLLQSELFGHEKGAFTGAIDLRKGFFELADRGTLFLDEIGEMPLSTQTKLLRVLEEREFLRVGAQQATRVDVRIIAATNQDLRVLVADRRFRRDLFYRLNILGIELPPLRRRREDVRRLVNHFVRELTQRLGRPFPGITEDAMELLVNYDWPGNVRELRNLVESMVVLAPRRPIGLDDVPKEIRYPGTTRALVAPPPPVGGLPAVSTESTPEARRLRPELEFVFRTLVELRVDMDQLRRDFELYRDEVDGRLQRSEGETLALPAYSGEGQEIGVRKVDDGGGELVGSISTQAATWEPPPPPPAPELEAGAVVFRPGMTMDALEEQAIRVTLHQTGGNRRRAAEILGIGERTLYRKIRTYGIEE
jgi:DNA-binding NtrC family response regulator